MGSYLLCWWGEGTNGKTLFLLLRESKPWQLLNPAVEGRAPRGAHLHQCCGKLTKAAPTLTVEGKVHSLTLLLKVRYSSAPTYLTVQGMINVGTHLPYSSGYGTPHHPLTLLFMGRYTWSSHWNWCVSGSSSNQMHHSDTRGNTCIRTLLKSPVVLKLHQTFGQKFNYYLRWRCGIPTTSNFS